MIDKYYLFKNEQGISYIIGPEGFNNNANHAFSKLQGWKFFDDNNQIYIITSFGEILAYFSEGDELVELLVKNNVAIEEMEIKEMGYDGKSPLPQISFKNGAYLVTHVGNSEYTFCYLMDKNKVKLFNYPLDKGLNHNKYQGDSIKNKFTSMHDQLLKSKLKLITEVSPDENGNPPEWLNLVKSNKEDNLQFENIKRIVGIIVMIIAGILLIKYS